MSSYKILNAINAAAASAFDSDGKTKAVKTVARFSVKAGVISVNAGTKALESVAPFGVTENEYRTYCDNIKALYFDSVHLAHALESKDKAAESKVRDIFYQDALALVHSMTDATFKVVPDVFETGAEVRDFEERCVAVLQKFVAGADGYDIEAVKISAFAKWVEPSIATRLSGVAMLSFEERDRRANLKKWVSKLARLEESLKTKRAEVEQAEKELAKDAERVAAGKMKESTYAPPLKAQKLTSKSTKPSPPSTRLMNLSLPPLSWSMNPLLHNQYTSLCPKKQGLARRAVKVRPLMMP